MTFAVKSVDINLGDYNFKKFEPPRLYRRVIYLSQAALSDSQRLS